MRTSLGIGIAFILGAILGYLFGDDGRAASAKPSSNAETSRAPRPSPQHTPRSTSPRTRDERLLDDLVLEVRNLSVLVSSLRDGTTTEVRRPAEGDGDPVPDSARISALDPELRAWMRKIDAAIANLSKSPGSLPVIQLPPAGVRPTRLPVPALDDEEQTLFAASHLLWSYQDVIDAYGRPDVVHDGDEWEFKFAAGTSGESELEDVHFVFRGGYVVHMYAH
jgi:hypothetical protein